MARIEVGKGEVWNFTATEAITSGSVVWLSGSAKVGVCHHSRAALGVALVPASAGKPIAVALQGIVDVATTGVGDTSFGTWMFGSGGKAAAGTFVSGAVTYLNSARAGGSRTLCLGFAVETITRNAKGKIFLTI